MKRLRILFLAGRDPAHPGAGGGDTQAFAWARWASQQGHTVTFVSQSADRLPQVDTNDGVQIRRLGTGVPLSWRAWRFYQSRHSDFDIVYEDPIGAGRIPYLSPMYAKVPVVAVWHQVTAQLLQALFSAPTAYVGSLLERGIARVYRNCQMWTPSEESASKLVSELGFTRSHIHVIPPTISPEVIGSSGPAQRDAIVLFVGVIRRYKSVHHAIVALPRILEAVPTARLVIAGRAVDETYLTELVQLVEQLDLGSRVVFKCSISEEEKFDLLQRSRVLVLPSVLEGFGIVTIEANAVGTPVVASSGVPRAAVDDGVNGFRYTYGDLDQLTDRTIRALKDDCLFERMTAASIAHANLFTTDHVASRFERLLSAALESNSA